MRVLSDFLGRDFCLSAKKMPNRISDKEIGAWVGQRVVPVVWRDRLFRPKSSDNTSDKKIGACSHSLTHQSIKFAKKKVLLCHYARLPCV